MMSLFYIWNPSLISREPPTLSFVLTTGDGDQIGHGSEGFVAGLLRDLGIDDKPTRWELTPIRSSYFADEPDADDWRDRWPLVWRARVELPAVPIKVPITAQVPRGTDADGADDDTFSQDDHWLTWASARSVVIADFVNEGDRKRAEAEISAARNKGAIPTVEVSRGEAFGRLPQLTIDLGERPNSYFEGGAPDAAKVAALVERCGGATNHVASANR
jgi:hypothetical protein